MVDAKVTVDILVKRKNYAAAATVPTTTSHTLPNVSAAGRLCNVDTAKDETYSTT
jgi:hypothetical protein